MEEITEILKETRRCFYLKEFEKCHGLLNTALAHCATFNERIISIRSLILRNLSLVLLHMNEADRALEVLNELVEIDSENASNFRRRADLLISFQNYTQALEDLQAGKTLAKHSGNSKEMLLIKQSLTKLHILQSQDSYWAID